MDVFTGVQDLLWEHAGIVRDEESLRAGLDALEGLAVDVGFMLTAAEAVLRGALARTESRGAHYRTDHAETDPDWQRNIYFESADVGGMTRYTEPVGTPSGAVQDAFEEGHELDYHQLE